jgi:hypothetical protein
MPFFGSEIQHCGCVQIYMSLINEINVASYSTKLTKVLNYFRSWWLTFEYVFVIPAWFYDIGQSIVLEPQQNFEVQLDDYSVKKGKKLMSEIHLFLFSCVDDLRRLKSNETELSEKILKTFWKLDYV